MDPTPLLSHLSRSKDLAPFRLLVEPLVRYDRERGSDLVRTLRVYFACGANASEAADKLFLHRNSMLYRITRIEKLTGIDPDKVGQEILASVGIGSPVYSAPAPEGVLEASGQPLAPASGVQAEPAAPSAWSSSQLLAYGVQTDEAGNLRRGDLRGSDVLNDMFLVRFAA